MSSHERALRDASNNVTYQRCQFAYEYAKPIISGKNVMDIGCGLAYGTEYMAEAANDITGVDYDQETVNTNKEEYKEVKNLHFKRGVVPPLDAEDNSVDVITAFQFIEHIKPRKEFIKDALRVLKPGGKLMVTTPNALKSLARNPFHVHEYTFDEMRQELSDMPADIELLGLKGNDTVNNYYHENSKFVRSILKWDFLGLHKKLPSSWLTGPYNWVTSIMRNKLKDKVDNSTHITSKDFHLDKDNLDEAWDIYLIATKNG
ncbi:MAG: class I SAM-dependent methyltransferase [Bacteroidia bacterium]|nr:class I SAM-dependent methyltransferase [Bacteroidia bacterium]